MLRDAVGISAPDDTTIVYKLVNPAPWFLSVLCTWNGLPVRQDLIEQELRLQGRDIDGALAMLRSSAEKSPLLARALARAED